MIAALSSIPHLKKNYIFIQVGTVAAWVGRSERKHP